MAKAAREALFALRNNSLICSGRPVLVRLGLEPEEAKSDAIYQISYPDSFMQPLKIELLVDGISLMGGPEAAKV